MIIEELTKSIHALHRMVSGGTEQKEDVQEVIRYIENLYYQLSKKESYDPNEKDSMFLSLERNEQERLRTLEEKASKVNSISLIQEQAKTIADKIHQFWREEGFHYVSNVKTDHYGTVEADFGFSLHFGSLFTDKKVSCAKKKEEKMQWLKEEGYQLDEKNKHLLDCDANKEKLEKLIQKRFPSSYIYSFESNPCNRTERKIFRMIVRISDILDI